MNIRFWSSWFIIFAFFTVALTMGCEKGSLGVKPATVVGRLVDAADLDKPIPNGIIRMIGKEAVGSSDLQQVNTFASVYSDSEGYFVFENVTPDNVIFQMSAPGYLSTSYPETVESTTEESSDDSGDQSTSTSTSEDIDSIAIRSGAMVDLRLIRMKKTSAATKVKVRLDFVDAITKKAINSGNFAVATSNLTYKGDADEWRSTGFEMDSSSLANLTITNLDGLYEVETLPTKLSSEAYIRVELTPLTLEFVVRAVNVPDYVSSGVEEGLTKLNVFAELLGTIPAQVIASEEFEVPLESSQSFFNIPLSSIHRGIRIRAQIRGYDDIIAEIPRDKFEEGSQGSYRLDIDFRRDGAKNPIDFDNYDWVVGAFDRIKWRKCEFVVDKFLFNPMVAVSLTHKNVMITPTGISLDVVSGYNMHYTYFAGSTVYDYSEEPIMVHPYASPDDDKEQVIAVQEKKDEDEE